MSRLDAYSNVAGERQIRAATVGGAVETTDGGYAAGLQLSNGISELVNVTKIPSFPRRTPIGNRDEVVPGAKGRTDRREHEDADGFVLLDSRQDVMQYCDISGLDAVAMLWSIEADDCAAIGDGEDWWGCRRWVCHYYATIQ